jgi:hypothetical protein
MLASCGDNGSTTTEPDATTLEDLAGTWEATSWMWTFMASSETYEAISDGYELTIVITAAGSITFMTAEPHEDEPDVSVGTITLDGSAVVIEDELDVMTGTCELTGNRLMLRLDPIELFGEYVKWDMEFVRR